MIPFRENNNNNNNNKNKTKTTTTNSQNVQYCILPVLRGPSPKQRCIYIYKQCSTVHTDWTSIDYCSLDLHSLCYQGAAPHDTSWQHHDNQDPPPPSTLQHRHWSTTTHAWLTWRVPGSDMAETVTALPSSAIGWRESEPLPRGEYRYACTLKSYFSIFRGSFLPV